MERGKRENDGLFLDIPGLRRKTEPDMWHVQARRRMEEELIDDFLTEKCAFLNFVLRREKIGKYEFLESLDTRCSY